MTAERRQSSRFVVIGDVGRLAGYHVGDDAMLFGLLAQAPDADWTVVADEPDAAAIRFGLRAVSTFGFGQCRDEAARRALLASVVQHSPSHDLLRSADALVIAGGGNLNASWPELVYERVALSRIARQHNVPVVLTGQSIGPQFGTEVAPLVAELLSSARYVGLRERSSAAFAQLLGVPAERIVVGSDDAAGLSPQRPAFAAELAMPFIAVSLNQLADDALLAIAGQLAEVSRRASAQIVLVPHVGDLRGEAIAGDQLTGDIAAADRVMSVLAAAGAAAVMAPLPSAFEAVWYCHHAEIVISSRYHPLVFAASGGTPMLFLFQDAYTAMKGVGALDQYGMAGWRLSIESCLAGELLPAAMKLWQQRRQLAGNLPSDLAERTRTRLAKLVDTLIERGLDGAQPTAAGPADAIPALLTEGAPHDATGVLAELERLRQRAEVAERYAQSLQEQAAQHRPYLESVIQRAEVAERYAESLLRRAELAEQRAAALEGRRGKSH
jgi:polysaccharide pyruvyl transferase WcaK-like protein